MKALICTRGCPFFTEGFKYTVHKYLSNGVEYVIDDQGDEQEVVCYNISLSGGADLYRSLRCTVVFETYCGEIKEHSLQSLCKAANTSATFCPDGSYSLFDEDTEKSCELGSYEQV